MALAPTETNFSMTEIVKKRRQLTLNEKLVFLDQIESGKRLTAAAREFGISNSTASGIVKDKSKIKLLHKHFKLSPHRKRIRLSLYSDVDEAVYLWFLQMRSKNTPINGPMLQHKAREFAQQLGHKNFEGSSGWLFRFRERHDMSVERMRGENNSESNITSIGMTDEEIVSSISHNNVPQIEYIVSDDIYNLNDVTSVDIGEEMSICSAELKEEVIDDNGASSNGSQHVNYCDSTDEVEESHLEKEESSPAIKLSEALNLMKNLTSFLEQQDEIPKHIWDSISNINSFMSGDLKERIKQKRITDYFK